MAIVNGLDRTKFFAEWNDPLDTQEGVLSPAVQKARAIANLFGGVDPVVVESDVDLQGVTQVSVPVTTVAGLATLPTNRQGFLAVVTNADPQSITLVVRVGSAWIDINTGVAVVTA